MPVITALPQPIHEVDFVQDDGYYEATLGGEVDDQPAFVDDDEVEKVISLFGNAKIMH